MCDQSVWKTRCLWNLLKHFRNKSLRLLCLSHTATDTSLSHSQSPCTLTSRTSTSLPGALFSCYSLLCLVWGRSGAPGNRCLFTPTQQSSNNWWVFGCNYPSSPPLGQDDVEVCFIHWLPEFSKRIKFQEPTVVPWLMMHSWRPSLLCLTPFKVFPEITSQINYLYVNPCLMICLCKNSKQENTK